ncbi:MAG: sulfatase-like hydrolase/transferase, partial [Myxococcota bacterium]|nr:sulfatase-like hydrolase/transferase [Myxococcota bacterium]
MLTRIWMTGLLLVGVGCHRAPAERPPDKQLVVLDTVRADRMSAYGYERPTSLQLAALAESGVRFSDVTVSGTWTWPGHGELFTGLPPWENGAHHKLDHPPGKPPINRLSDNIPTLAEHFSAAGYRSLAFA